MGEMLEQSWEAYATQLANATSTEDFLTVVDHIIHTARIDLNQSAQVIYARDTR
jgi:phosphoacetylglucosamine mutase